MKKIIILTTVLFSTIVFSQKQNSFGAFSGINYSYFTDGFGGSIAGENSIGLQIGALYNVEITKKVSFRPKVIFSQQGDRTRTERQDSGSLQLSELDYKLTYLNVPLDFKFWNKIYVIAGPQIGFLIAQNRGDVHIGTMPNIDIGINLGTGFKIHHVFVEFGIYQGATTLLNYRYNTGNTVDVKNGLAKFTLGYNF